MEIVIEWNIESGDQANRELIESKIREEIEDSCERMGIDTGEAIATINNDPYFNALLGAVQANGEIVMTFTYSLSSPHRATYFKVT